MMIVISYYLPLLCIVGVLVLVIYLVMSSTDFPGEHIWFQVGEVEEGVARE